VGTSDNARQLSSYTQFLKTWPDGPHKDIALARQNELIDIRDTWTRIHNSDDERELERFIAQFGWSEFGAQATDRLVSIRREKNLPSDKSLVTLAADDMARLLDGAVLTFPGSGATISFFSSLMPSYRISLGKDFLTRQFNQSFAAEGVFRAEFTADDRQPKFDGLGGIVKSKVDSTGSLFLVQMFGTEKTSRDIDNKDRKYATFQIIRDAFGYVCIGTNWQSILSREEPKKVVERCTIRRQ